MELADAMTAAKAVRLPRESFLGACTSTSDAARKQVCADAARVLLHKSTSAATRELGLFFKSDELLDWTPASQSWVYDMAKGQPE